LITCSKCGAANSLGTVECRMCASRLTGPDGSGMDGPGMDMLNTTVVFANVNTRPGTSGLTECLICPECGTINNIGWLFCPQCGKKVDTSFLRSMELADQAPTIAAVLFPDQAPAPGTLQTAVTQLDSRDALSVAGNREDAPLAPQQPDQRSLEPQPQQSDQWWTNPEPQPPRKWSLDHQPQQSDQLPMEAQPQQTDQASFETQLPPQLTAIPEPPRQQASDRTVTPVNSSNGAAEKQPDTPAPAAEHTTVACSECGSYNNADYFFCHSCGASLPVTKTIVMASIAHPVKPRLRLLLQNGESGPTYEISNETRIGRTEGSITFPQDSFMSSSHARIVKRGADFILIDEASSNGTFLRVKRETKLESGDVILAGGQLLRFEP
jgi:hypothetical protein